MERDPAELIDQHVAARIRARRIDLGITLQALARQIGVAFQQAHKYERGLSRISAGRLFHVASALKAPVGFFFATTDPAAGDAIEGGSSAADKARAGPDANHASGIDSAG
jgi:transcriptional regulator with XRE-family HTH domain